MKIYLNPILLLLSLALSSLAQADTFVCDPQDLQDHHRPDPAISDQGPLLRMRYLTPAQGSHYLALSDWTTYEGLQSRPESEAAPQVRQSTPACPPGLLPPHIQSPEPRQAPVRIWL